MAEGTAPRHKKKARDEDLVIFFVDEAGVGLLPSVGKTYAPKGETPVIGQKCRYKHLCVISAICSTGKMFWSLRPDAFKGPSIVHFLKGLLAFAKKKVLVIWDGASIHRSEEVRSFLGSMQDGEVWLERSPPIRRSSMLMSRYGTTSRRCC